MEVGLGPDYIVLDGTQLLLPRERGSAASPHTLAHVYCGQAALWITIPVDTEEGLGPGDVVLDGDRKGHSSPHFSAHVSGTVAHLSC